MQPAEYVDNSTLSNLKKYRQAACAYILMGAAYMFVFFYTMPPHDFGIHVKIIVPIFGFLLMALSWFVYQGYRRVVIVLAVIYAIRSIVAASALFFGRGFIAVKYVLPLLIFTFFMLGRAAWDWKP